MIVRAVLKKLATDDGLIEFATAYVGKEYLVDLTTIHRGQTMVHYYDDCGAPPIVHQKDIIYTVDDEWLPCECLELRV
jgi:hypothetical protein